MNIGDILKEEGFAVVKLIKPGKWLSFSYVLHLARTCGESSLAEFLYQLVKGNKLGAIPLYLNLQDNIVLICKKSI